MIKPAAFTMHLKELQYIVSILLLYEMCFYDMLVKEWTSLFFFFNHISSFKLGYFWGEIFFPSFHFCSAGD